MYTSEHDRALSSFQNPKLIILLFSLPNSQEMLLEEEACMSICKSEALIEAEITCLLHTSSSPGLKKGMDVAVAREQGVAGERGTS